MENTDKGMSALPMYEVVLAGKAMEVGVSREDVGAR